MIILYPDIKPYTEHRLSVDDIHTLHVEECGNKDGIPVLVLHGGPGAGCEPFHRRFFDPEKFRIILFDQRGSGRSMPHAELRDNTTQHLIDDIEKIRNHLDVEQWMLFGGSWGATLAVAYGEAFPEKILGMVLRGIFLCRERDIDWFYKDGASRMFPDAWEEYLKPLDKADHDNIIQGYYKKLTGADEIARMSAAKAWSLWEGHCATLRPSHNVIDHFSEPHTALSLARIEAHYFLNKAFMEPNQLLDNAHKLADIPSTLVHGRYDMVCPLENAFELHRAWPGSELHIVRDAGHAGSEAGIVDALVRAVDDMAKLLRDDNDDSKA
ncbi:MAG: prolyl aminopeptidase [Pseudomonadales bacterium]|nr:prolyl aminopeptidase [Pseudomonadales bacterium]